MERFGEKLRVLRQRDGLSLRQLASLLGYSSHSLIADIEKGKKKPSVELAILIADVFNVTTDQLLLDDEELE